MKTIRLLLIAAAIATAASAQPGPDTTPRRIIIVDPAPRHTPQPVFRPGWLWFLSFNWVAA